MNNHHANNGHLSVAHFSWEYPPKIWGGLGTFSMELTKQQKTMGHNVSVFAVNDQNKFKSFDTWNDIPVYRPKIIDFTDSLNIVSNNDLQQWGNHLSFFSMVLGYNIMSASKLVNELSDSRHNTIDIIDAHDWLGILGGIMVKQSIQTPLIFHVHSTEHGRSGGNGSTTISSIEKHGGNIADGVITVSNAMKNELISLGFPNDSIHVCWNGIDPKKYDPDTVSIEDKQKLRYQYNIKDDEIFLFFIGRLVTVKGIKQLVEALPEIISSYPKVKLVILGIGDLDERLKQRVVELGIQDHVIFRTEFVSEEERIIHYAASDIVVLPSLYEPFGIVCTEAMSMKKPVVVGAKGVSGMREQIVASGEEQCGIHVNAYNPMDISWGVKQLLDNQDQLEWIGGNGRKRVIDLFTWKKITKRTMDIYQTILQ